MTLYRDLIAKAFAMSWRHRFLWILAFFVALGGLGGEYGFFFRGADFLNNQAATLNYLRADYLDGSLFVALQNLPARLQDNPVIWLMLVVGLVIFLGILWVILVAQGGLIWSIDQLRQTTAAKKLSLGQANAAGIKAFPGIFMISVLLKILIYILLVLATVPLGIAFIRTGNDAYFTWYTVSAFLVMVPISIIISFLLKYAAIAIVLRGKRWMEALQSSWQLFVSNWLVSLEVAFILFAINLVTTLVLIYTLDLLGLPSNPAGALIFATALTLWGTYMAAFQYTAWVLLYEHLEEGTVRSKLSRVIEAWRAPLPPATSGTKQAAK